VCDISLSLCHVQLPAAALLTETEVLAAAHNVEIHIAECLTVSDAQLLSDFTIDYKANTGFECPASYVDAMKLLLDTPFCRTFLRSPVTLQLPLSQNKLRRLRQLSVHNTGA
jgi:hypothetical protein